MMRRTFWGERMGKHVLLIEDEPNIIEAISFLLQQDGWKVSTHSDSSGAVDAVLNIGPDLVILDVMLPGRSGFDVLQDLRRASQTEKLPILMLTAKGQARDRAEAMSLGASHFMTKPFSNRDMLAAVRELAT